MPEIRSRWLRLTRAAAVGAELIVIAASCTADPIVPYLGVRRHDATGALPDVRVAPYGQIFQVCLNWQSMWTVPPAAIVLIWRIEDLLRPEFQSFLRGDAAALRMAADKTAELCDALRELRRRFGGIIVVSVPPFPAGPDHDPRSARSVATAGAFHRRIVDSLVAGAGEIAGVSFLDLDAVQRCVGLEQSADPRKWYLYRQPFTERFWSEAAAELADALQRQRAAAKKCLVVDCDNTLWGGIVGEDGLEGIALGEDFPGSAFRDFQQQLITLRSRGVMLAICSKNNEQDVWEVFDRHDGMVLKRADLVAHRINWLEKAGNIESMAAELNIGLDSLVFVDDNPVEIAAVQSSLPMVHCIQVPDDVARLPAIFGACRLFDREVVSDEDRIRSDMMLQERQRTALGRALPSEDFKQSLQLAVDFFRVQAEHVARVTQLINKTNQFNLTTRRRTAGEVQALCGIDGTALFAWRVADRFGDYGLVGVAVLVETDGAVEIDTLLMSCRVLGRGVEEAVLAAIAAEACRRGAVRLTGRYVPTPKSSLVADFYRDHGFRATADGGWEADDLGRFRWPDFIARVPDGAAPRG